MEEAKTTQVIKVVQRRAPTPKQRKAAKALSENIRDNNETKSTGEILREVGYTLTQSLKPQVVTNSQGFLAALDELGLTDEFVVSSLVEDIRLKPQKRAFELSIAAKIRGLDRRAEVAPQGTMNIANAVILFNTPKERLTEPPKE